MFKWFTNWLDKMGREVDMRVLWPACKSQAKDLDHAKAAFFYHTVRDPAWTDHFSDQEIFDYVDKLE